MNKIVQVTSIIILFLFLLFGVVTSILSVHELSHKQDFGNIAENGTLCALVIPNNLKEIWTGRSGYYDFSYNVDNTSEYNRISKYTEVKAYGIMFVVFLIFIVSFVIFLISLPKKKS